MASSFYIYMIHNIINNKVYVGKTYHVNNRWSKHLKVASSSRIREKFHLHYAISKYGKDNFVFSILQSFPCEQLANQAEKYWINYFNSIATGYNLTAGGEGCLGRKLSEETKNKIRQKSLGRKHSSQTKSLLRELNRGKMPSNISQLAALNSGKKLTIQHKSNISLSKTGKSFSKQHKQNLSASLKGLFKGEKNPQAKLTKQLVLEIRNKYHSNQYTKTALAQEYNISRSQINRIISNNTWKNLGSTDE
jgi:group I intron endonuclease